MPNCNKVQKVVFCKDNYMQQAKKCGNPRIKKSVEMPNATSCVV